MIVTVGAHGDALHFDLSRPVDLTTPVVPGGAQPNAFGLPLATATPFRAGTFVGDTRQGGPVNCAVLTLAPHGNGTHVESAAHVSHAASPVDDALSIVHLVATIVTVPLRRLGETSDGAQAAEHGDEWVLARADLAQAVASHGGFRDALVIRHTPGGDGATRAWSEVSPPYPSDDAMDLLAASSLRALALDVPSVDRTVDAGRLRNHRVWWGLPETGHDALPHRPDRLIIEMASVPDDLADGIYLLGVAVPHIALDALPEGVVVWPRLPSSNPATTT